MSASEHPTSPSAPFGAGRAAWLERQGLLRNTLRQELVRRQLEVHLPLAPATVLDVGAGQGTQAIALAREGYTVTAVEPDAGMRAAFEEALAAEKPAVRGRVTLLDESLETLDEVFGMNDVFDAVLCHGVLMYLPDPNPGIRALGRRLADDGILSVLARNTGAMAWRHALRGDYARAQEVLDEVELAQRERRDARYTNEIGVPARADTIERLGAFFGGSRVFVEAWYGIRTFTDGIANDAPLPEDPAELAGMLDLEYRFSRTEPYRRMGTLLHVIGRRGEGRGPQITF